MDWYIIKVHGSMFIMDRLTGIILISFYTMGLGIMSIMARSTGIRQRYLKLMVMAHGIM